jgi:disulfide bond formation protein DsbB
VDHVAVEQILSILALVALACIGVTWVGAALERLGVGTLGSRIADLLAGAEVPLAAVAALVATSGSLYFSESVGYIPCVLCWFQRIAMYPLAVVLVLGTLRRERAVAPYALAAAAAGLAVSIYHYQLEWFPDQASVCDKTVSVPCSVVWFKHFGVATIPFLAGAAFLAIGTLMVVALRNERRAASSVLDDEFTEEPRALWRSVALSVVVGAAAAGIGLWALGGHEQSSSSDAAPSSLVRALE